MIKENKRAECFRLLAACFYLPQKKLFLKENLFENLSFLLKDVCPEAEVFSKKMKHAISLYGEEELSVEHAKLFVGPFELAAPPYGSIYLDTGKTIMNDSTMEVSRRYEEAGLKIDKEFKELPDHIAAELEFMYFLAYKELKEVERSQFDRALFYRDKQKCFLDDILLQWVPSFCEKIKEGTDNKFYRALADCLSSFIKKHKIFLYAH